MAVTLTFEAIGTSWNIDLYDDVLVGETEKIRSEIMQCIEEYEKVYSRFRDDSIVSQIAKKEGEYTLPKSAKLLLTEYHTIYRLTGGAVTPLIGQMLIDAGYDASYSLSQKKELTSPPCWEDVLDFRYPTLKVKKPAQLDFGAAGKGYLIDLVSEVLVKNNINGFCVDAGGDMRHQHKSPLRVGLENPKDTTQVVGVVTLQNVSLCASAGNRRAWGNFHHIMNPHTAQSAEGIAAVWVVAKTTLLADILTTALFFVPPSVLQSEYEFEYLVLHTDFSFEKSKAFPAELFLE